MKYYNKENIDVLNYISYIKNKKLIYRNYKLVIKNIGCNARCPMCNDWKQNGDIKKLKHNLKKALKLIILEKINFKHIQILGGEPLLMFDSICKIVYICKQTGITIDFPTNASLLTYKHIDKLINLGLDNFTFSLDFPDEEHDKWRMLEGVFKKICDYTNYIQKKGLVVQWNTVIGKFNYKLIKNFENTYKKAMPNIHSFIAIEENGGISKMNILNNDEIEKIKIAIYDLKTKYKINIISNGFNINYNKVLFKKCYIPLKTKKIFITENSITESLCYYDLEIEDQEKFIDTAINIGCDKCNSSFKENYNNFIKKNNNFNIT